MSDSPTMAPAAFAPASIETLGATIAQEVSDRAAKLMRLQAIQTKLQDAKAAYAKVLQDVAECHSQYQSEMAPSAVAASA